MFHKTGGSFFFFVKTWNVTLREGQIDIALLVSCFYIWGTYSNLDSSNVSNSIFLKHEKYVIIFSISNLTLEYGPFLI